MIKSHLDWYSKSHLDCIRSNCAKVQALKSSVRASTFVLGIWVLSTDVFWHSQIFANIYWRFVRARSAVERLDEEKVAKKSLWLYRRTA